MRNKSTQSIAMTEEQKRTVESSYSIPVFTDYKEMLDNVDCDIVVVFNPNDEKPEVVIEGISRKKYVIVNKPMAIEINKLNQIENELKK